MNRPAAACLSAWKKVPWQKRSCASACAASTRSSAGCRLADVNLKPNITMWTCSKCREKHEDEFDSCWKCNQPQAGALVAGTPLPEDKHPVQCVRCDIDLDYAGTRRFHEGTRWGVLGDLGELFVARESFDVFVCPRCGRVEFFVEGIGEEFRPPLKERGASQMLREATRLEIKGKVSEALALYEEAATKYPDTEAGRDARISMETLKEKLK